MRTLLTSAGLAALALRFAFVARRTACAGRLVSTLADTGQASMYLQAEASGRERAGERADAGEFRSATTVVLASGVCGTLAGFVLAGVPGGIAGAVIGASVPRSVSHRRAAAAAATLDSQVSEFADGVASAVRGGLSISRAVEFAAEETDPPLRRAAEALLRSRTMGVPLTRALDSFAASVATDEARLLALVLDVHHRSGGNVASALDEIRSTIRHRLDLRRELRAITAQGRISGLILGILPLAFLVVLSVTSHRELAPVLHSPAGAAFVSAGLILEGLAYLWIKRLLRVEV